MSKISEKEIGLRNQVFIHFVKLDVDPAKRIKFAKLLSEKERKRAGSFHFQKDSDLFMARHATLRMILSSYCNTPPEDLKFGSNEYGKPCLAFPATSLHFNVSRSADSALYAVSRSHEVGVDLEYIHRKVDYVALANKFFSRDETKALQSVSNSALPRSFYRCWTRKEAYVKALGEGLSFPFNTFSVSIFDEEQVELRGSGSGWSLYNLNLSIDYAAALVVQD
jgi:4'-phosphopantetheinyl transferase